MRNLKFVIAVCVLAGASSAFASSPGMAGESCPLKQGIAMHANTSNSFIKKELKMANLAKSGYQGPKVSPKNYTGK